MEAVNTPDRKEDTGKHSLLTQSSFTPQARALFILPGSIWARTTYRQHKL